MVVVYLKNGEKAPLPDADEVCLEATDPAKGLTLRCFWGEREVGLFKWDEVAGYSLSSLRSADALPPGSTYDAWHERMQLEP
jgi:hypothetical protein